MYDTYHSNFLKHHLGSKPTLPHFEGDGYLIVKKLTRVAKKHELNAEFKNDITFLYLNFSTVEDDGLIIWTALVSIMSHQLAKIPSLYKILF